MEECKIKAALRIASKMPYKKKRWEWISEEPQIEMIK